MQMRWMVRKRPGQACNNMNPIDEKLKLLQPVLGTQKAKRLRLMYLMEDDYRQKKEIENRIDLLIAKPK